MLILRTPLTHREPSIIRAKSQRFILLQEGDGQITNIWQDVDCVKSYGYHQVGGLGVDNVFQSVVPQAEEGVDAVADRRHRVTLEQQLTHICTCKTKIVIMTNID